MTGVGQAAGEDDVVEAVGHRVAHNHAAGGHVTGVAALGEGDDVRRVVVVVECEPEAGAAEAGHDLVGDHQDAVLLGDLAHALEVVLGRNDDACGARHGFEQHGGDGVRALELDHVLEVSQRTLALLFLGGCGELGAIQVRGEEVHVAARVVVGLTAPVTGGADGRTGVAVVAAVGRQNLVAASEQAGGAHRVFIGVGASVGEEHLVEAFRSAAGHQGGGAATG